MNQGFHSLLGSGIAFDAVHAGGILSGAPGHGRPSLAGLRPNLFFGAPQEIPLGIFVELSRWQQAGQMAKFGHWQWTADVPGGWANGHSEYSAEGAAVLGLDPDDLTMGTSAYCERIVHPADGERVLSFCDHMNDQGDRTYSIEYRIVQPSGEVREVLEFAENSYDAAGRIVSTAGTIQDMTERKHLEKKLRETHTLDALVQVAGGVAHNCNNLLAVILGNAELLAEELKNNGLAPMQPNMIIAAAQRGAEFVDKLLTYARLQPLAPEPVNINKLIAGLLPRLVSGFGAEIEIETKCDVKLWPALIDPVRLELALLDLVANAREAMPQGGRIRIETANVDLDRPFVAWNEGVGAGPRVMIAMIDGGTGMPPEVAARAFDPFFTTKEFGKGLGLSIVHGFINQSGGDIEIESRIGSGTAVRLYLPRAEGQSSIGGRLM